MKIVVAAVGFEQKIRRKKTKEIEKNICVKFGLV